MPGGGGMGLPVAEVGGRTGASRRAAGAAAGGAVGAAGGRTGASAAGAGTSGTGRATGGSSRRTGPALPEDEMTRLGATGAADGASTGAVCAVAAVTGVSASTVGDGATTAGSGSTAVGSATGATGASDSAEVSSALVAAAFLAGAFLAAAFLAGFFSASGSSGWTSRIRPSFSALRRTRSACASTTLEEWVLTPIPSATQRSRVSLLVSPSSRASSWTRMFDGNCYLCLLDIAMDLGPGDVFPDGTGKRLVILARPTVAHERGDYCSSEVDSGSAITVSVAAAASTVSAASGPAASAPAASSSAAWT